MPEISGHTFTRASPPQGFDPLSDSLWGMEYVDKPRFKPQADPISPAKQRGVRYEHKAIAALRPLFTNVPLCIQPWYRCNTDEGQRICSPDFVVFPDDHVIVFEMKVTHTDLAWWQLNRLYKPALGFLYQKPVRCVEVTRSYDPAVVMPQPVVVVFTLAEMMDSLAKPDEDRTLVVQWRP